MATYDEMRGSMVYDKNHDKAGTLEDFYLDEDTSEPTWITVKTGLFGSRSSFVPLSMVSQNEDGLVVNATKEQINDAPGIDSDGQLAPGEEKKLYEYYRRISPPSDEQSQEEAGKPTVDSVTVDRQEVETNGAPEEIGRMRLKKYIVTENVTFTIPVQREEIRLVPEKDTEDNNETRDSDADTNQEQAQKKQRPVM